MPDEAVHASPTDVRRLAKALEAYKTDVKSASKKVNSALGAARWHDSRKAQFESRYKDLQKRIDGFMSGEVDQMVKQLNELARRLEEIRSIRM